MSTKTHIPVMLEEVLEGLNIRPDGCYADGTFGRGGHARAILERLGPQGRLLAIDKDPQAIAWAREQFGDDPRVTIQQGSFCELPRQVRQLGWWGQVDGILLDLGVSSPQLDDPARGFSFREDGPLDMRMDPGSGQSAAEWLASAEEQDIAAVLKEYGEERFARRIARAIIREREKAPIDTTRRLAAIVAGANPTRERNKDPATRSFQAIRIFINSELEDLKKALPEMLEALRPGGRLVVISFHSLEDRIVKRFIREQQRGDDFPPDLPITHVQLNSRLRAVGKARFPSAEEVRANPRSRSAVLRIAERLS
ncbi:MAG TPA: 16S rRNA (cytosine(1402)-N(4))-methyltransferase RsmH [Gammaproteobacteria bacterium]|nr:16S rRNA (cytosine(1402)-N(4))-methyltransferase RsmH [Gammaproteobacteria bacterium]